MGTSRSPGELVGKIDRFAKALGDTRKPLEAVGLAGKAVFIGAAPGAIGATLAGKRKPIGARYDLKHAKGDRPSVTVTYTGPAHLLNNPTAQHFITARRQASRARARQLALGVGAVAAFGGSARGMFGKLGKQSLSRSGIQRGGARSLTIGPNHRAYAFHPGTKGKGFAQRAKATLTQTAPQVYRRAGITGPLKEVFR